MPITINGSGTVTGISAGGLPDGVITTDDIAANAVTQAKRSEQLTLDTAKASTSGTFIDFTGIPSWVKRVTVMFSGVSTSGTSLLLARLGTSSGVESTGYAAGSFNSVTVNQYSGNVTTGFPLSVNIDTSNTSIFHGAVVFTTLGSNIWVAQGSTHESVFYVVGCTIAGSKTLSGTLDRIRITTVNGTDTFDGGSINILYE